MKYLLFLISVVILTVSACAQSAPVTSAPGEREVSVDGKVYRVITANQLKTMLDNKDFLLVNVHIPYAGEITGTDLFISYLEIEKNLDKLPDKNGSIVVYCRSGSMSAIASKTLTGLGYTNIRDVEGGMVAWEQAGYELIDEQR